MTSQISLFGGEEPLKINKKIRLIELFTGIVTGKQIGRAHV